MVYHNQLLLVDLVVGEVHKCNELGIKSSVHWLFVEAHVIHEDNAGGIAMH